MIIKGEPNKVSRVINPILILLLILIIVLGFRFDWISLDKGFRSSLLIKCNVEKVRDGLVVADGHTFGSDILRSKEESRSGSYSIKLDSLNRQGLKYIIENPRPGKRYKVSVWSKNPHPTDASIVVSAINQGDFYISSRNITKRDGDYWDKRELSFQVPFEPVLDFLEIYVIKDPGRNAIYFDDLEIREAPTLINQDDGRRFEPDLFHIQIDRAGLDYLDMIKRKSIAKGLVFHEDKKIEIKVLGKGEPQRADLRIKGDWLDHLAGYASYRIDMYSEFSWKGLQSFSVQDPTTRGMIRNWVFGQFLDYADILHPRTDFILMKQNNDEPFVFSYEEHFTKNLLESQERREGPIIKFMETRMWDITGRHINYFKGELPDILEKEKAYWSSDIKAFKENKIFNNPVLKQQYELAQNLMLQYKYHLKSAEEIFDLDRLARYLALVDICLAHHAITWHNQRFYYNPVSAVLEPIGFDGYTNEDPNKYASVIWNEKVYQSENFPYEPLEQLFFEKPFADLYFKYLFKYSEIEFIEMMLDELEEGIRAREKFLGRRFSNYRYDRQEILDKAKIIRRNIYPSSDAFRVYTQSDGQYMGINNHDYPLWVFTENMKDSTLIFPGKQSEQTDFHNLNSDAFGNKIAYKVAGVDSLFFTKVSNYKPPHNSISRQDLQDEGSSLISKIAIDTLGKYFISKGNYIIDQALIIPKNKPLEIEAGCKMKFQGEGLLLSYSNINFNGTKEEPVFIECIDGKNGSITVLQADERSHWKHVLLQGQNTLLHNNWNLTGAVSFYESEVDMEYVRFDSNRCEDALNIIKSNFELSYCHFQSTYGDAFDADFCKGLVSNCIFVSSGNDGMDFSGSTIEVQNSQIIGAGDKGISVGEQSTVQLRDLIIKGANIAIASKDMSVLRANELDIRDCNTGFTAFQKKPEYGPATIILGKFKSTNVKREFIIEENSILEREYQ